MAATAKPTARDRARAQTVEDIKHAARARLAEDGSDLSLRAVARDVGMVSSAVYRYFASRDELLTALIVDAYRAMGDAAVRAEAKAPRRNLLARWTALCRELRAWSRAHPHEYALLYGTPVPGYAAPTDTVAAAQIPLVVAAAIVQDAVAAGLEAPPDRLPRAVRADLKVVQAYPGFEDLPPTVLARLMTVWATLFGTVSFELFGRYNNAVENLDDWFELQVQVMARHVGLA